MTNAEKKQLRNYIKLHEKIKSLIEIKKVWGISLAKIIGNNIPFEFEGKLFTITRHGSFTFSVDNRKAKKQA